MVRIKNRYIIAQFLPTKTTTSIKFATLDIQIALRDKISELYGDCGAGTFGNNTYVKFHEDALSNIFIVRTSREDEAKVHFALNCIAKIKEEAIVIRTLSVKSTSRTCEEQYMELYKTVVSQQELLNEEEKEKLVQSMQTTLTVLDM